MQVYALDQNNNRVFVECADKTARYLCLECGKTVRLRGGPHVQLHFYHAQPTGECRQNGKSFSHIGLQKFIQKSCGDEVEQEVRFDTINRIADCVWFPKKVIFEVQCSPISADEVRKRIRDYASVGFRVIWILHEKEFNRRKVSAAESALIKEPHYFAKDFEIYDQCSVSFRGIRHKRFFQTPVDISCLQTREVATVENEVVLPHSIGQRISSWSHYIEGDLIDRAMRGSKNGFEKAVEFERALFPEQEKRKKRAFHYIVSFVRAVYHHLVEQSCK